MENLDKISSQDSIKNVKISISRLSANSSTQAGSTFRSFGPDSARGLEEAEHLHSDEAELYTSPIASNMNRYCSMKGPKFYNLNTPQKKNFFDLPSPKENDNNSEDEDQSVVEYDAFNDF